MSSQPTESTPTPTPVPSTGNSTASNTQSSVSSTTRAPILIPPNAPVGAILMTQPPLTAVSFYKIGPSQLVTFGWNFTAVLQQPDSLTVSAIGDNGNTYPVGPTDGVLPGTATEVVWDLHKWQTENPQMPLDPGTYTLTICDNRGTDAVKRAGYLEQFDSLNFGLYTPGAYTPLASGWQCTLCKNGSVASAVTHPAFVGIMISFLVIFLSGLHTLRTNH